MGNWTPTPWQYDLCGDAWDIYSDGNGGITTILGGSLLFGRAEADAKRIVQCVNALSKNGPVAELVEMVLNIGWTKPNPLAFIDVLSLEEMREKANRLRQLIEGGDDD